jgi:hypothetical protein
MVAEISPGRLMSCRGPSTYSRAEYPSAKDCELASLVRVVAMQWRDDAPVNLVLLAAGKRLGDRAEVTDATWRELALMTNTREQVEGHSRLLRALYWGDDDYQGSVYDVLPRVLGDISPPSVPPDPWAPVPKTVFEKYTNLQTVSDYLRLPEWLVENEPELAAKVLREDNADALLPDGTVLTAVEAAAGRLGVAEMRREVERIRRDHGEDAEALVGHVKELVESTCKTILGLTGDKDTRADVPALVTKTLKHLGLHPEDVESAGGDPTEARALKRLFGGLSSVLAGAAELRNRRGSGHGRSGAPLVDDALARLTAGMVMAAVVYLCEIYEARTARWSGQPGGAGPRLTDADVVVGSVVEHETFGRGQVEEAARSGQQFMTVVNFAAHGPKRLLMRYAPLVLIRR